MIDDRYHIKIVPHKGQTLHRFTVRRRHVAIALAVLAMTIVGSLAFAGVQTWRAHAQVAALRAQAQKQRASLQGIDRQTTALRRALTHVQKQDEEIRQLIGAPAATKHVIQKTAWVQGRSLRDAQSRIALLRADSAATTRDSNSVRTLAMRVLNIRHIANLARARTIAAIPSIDPIAGATITGCFCYRTYPDTEFHDGVDLAANYGEVVRAAAAGTVVSAAYDGGYGNKIVIDHGNGYSTWYAHLSSMNVSVGQHVYKGETIAAAGATGFATGPHLHYQIMHDGTPVNPTPFLRGVPANVLAAAL